MLWGTPMFGNVAALEPITSELPTELPSHRKGQLSGAISRRATLIAAEKCWSAAKGGGPSKQKCATW